MEDTKKWFESKTILASIVTLLALISGAVGYTIDADTQNTAVELITVVVGGIGSLAAIVGRIKASKVIK